MNLIACLKHLLACGAVAAAALAGAQPTAGGTVKILVGFPAGGAPDAVARVFAEQVRQVTGATVIVDNRPGATGKIAIDALLSSPADGATVSLIPSAVLALTPLVMKSAKYDSVRDFVALGSLAEHGFGIAAGPASKATTIAGYTEWAKAHPKDSSFASPGLGTPQHFLGAQLQKLLGVELMHVPYKGGAAAMNDVIGGQVPLLITSEQFLVPFEDQGKLKTLLVTSRQRNPKLPNVPTAREAGMLRLEAHDWFGLFARSETPVVMVTQWRDLIVRILASSQYADAVTNLGFTVPAVQAADFPRLLAAERAAWAERVKLSEFVAAD